jgi:hypothetical protein
MAVINLEQGYDNIWSWLSRNQQMSPDEIIHQVDLNVSSLVNKIMNEPPSAVLIFVGRKVSHLLSQYRTTLGEKFLIIQLVTMNQLQMLRTKPSLSVSTKTQVIIVSDTIHTGIEMSTVLRDLKHSKREVNKVFCYLKNEEGLNSLLEEKLITREKVVGLFTSSSEEEYYKEATKLHVFFRSIIEPLELDLTYNQYSIDKPLSAKEIVKILKTPLKKLGVTIKKVNEEGCAKNYEEILFRIGEMAYYKKDVRNCKKITCKV